MSAQTNIPYWRLSSFYFFYFSFLGALSSYWNLYLSNSGFNAAQIGELSALGIITKIITPMVGGTLSDKTNNPLKVVQCSCFTSLILYYCFFLKEDFLWYALITFGYYFSSHMILPQFQIITLHHLHAESHRYSQIRLWGSIGFIGGILIMAELLNYYPLKTLFVSASVFLMCSWLITSITPKTQENQVHQDSFCFMHILKKPEVIAFYVTSFLLQASDSAYYAFYSIYLDQLHYSYSVISQLRVISVIAEILLFLFVHNLSLLFLQRDIWYASILLSILRWSIIAFKADSLYWLIGAQLLHAASFGMAHVVAIHFIAQYFGQTHQGKGRAVYSSFSSGIGGTVGVLFSGYYWESHGGTFVFACSALSCWLALIIAYYGIKKTTVMS